MSIYVSAPSDVVLFEASSPPHPVCFGIGATIRIGREIQCVPFAYCFQPYYTILQSIQSKCEGLSRVFFVLFQACSLHTITLAFLKIFILSIHHQLVTNKNSFIHILTTTVHDLSCFFLHDAKEQLWKINKCIFK